jgi:hypothetical protein
MTEERRIVELGVGDVDLVEGLWTEMVGHSGSTPPARPGTSATVSATSSRSQSPPRRAGWGSAPS